MNKSSPLPARHMRVVVADATRMTGNSGASFLASRMLRLYREDAGQSLTEYALLIILVVLVALATMKTLGSVISNVFANAASNVTSGT
jgi:Flp pilus assembly pilin Flp